MIEANDVVEYEDELFVITEVLFGAIYALTVTPEMEIGSKMEIFSPGCTHSMTVVGHAIITNGERTLPQGPDEEEVAEPEEDEEEEH